MQLCLDMNGLLRLHTLWNTSEPRLDHVAVLAELAGVDGVALGIQPGVDEEVSLTLHLRATVKGLFHLAIPPTMEGVKVALRIKPSLCWLVPDGGDEGGMDLQLFGNRVGEMAGHLKSAGLRVGVRLSPDLEQLKVAHRLGISLVALDPQPFHRHRDNGYALLELDRLKKATQLARKLEMSLWLAEGLDERTLPQVSGLYGWEGVSLGGAFWARALLMGISSALPAFRPQSETQTIRMPG